MLYDFFISYSSFDVAVARRIAEQLMSHGYRVWFDEYVILVKGRSKFREAIAEGLARSQRGLLIVGDHYAASQYCRFEAEELDRRLPAGATLPFLLGPQTEFQRAFSALSPSAIPLTSNEPHNELLRKLKEMNLTAGAATSQLRSGDPENRWHVREAALSFARSGWRLDPGSQFRAMVWNDLPSPEGGARSEFHRLSWLGGADIRLSFDYERQSGMSARRLLERHQILPSEYVAADRARLEEELDHYEREREILFRSVPRCLATADLRRGPSRGGHRAARRGGTQKTHQRRARSDGTSKPRRRRRDDPCRSIPAEEASRGAWILPESESGEVAQSLQGSECR